MYVCGHGLFIITTFVFVQLVQSAQFRDDHGEVRCQYGQQPVLYIPAFSKAMDQHQGIALTAYYIVQLNAVHIGKLAFKTRSRLGGLDVLCLQYQVYSSAGKMRIAILFFIP